MTPLLAATLFLVAVCMLGGWYLAGGSGAVVGGFLALVVASVAVCILGGD